MDNTRTFRLKRELPNLKKGALYQARVNGEILDNMSFSCITPESYKRQQQGSWNFYGNEVQEKKFFEEVFRVSPEYLTATELKKYRREHK